MNVHNEEENNVTGQLLLLLLLYVLYVLTLGSSS